MTIKLTEEERERLRLGGYVTAPDSWKALACIEALEGFERRANALFDRVLSWPSNGSELFPELLRDIRALRRGAPACAAHDAQRDPGIGVAPMCICGAEKNRD